VTQLFTVDTSLVVAALSSWHEAHKSAAEACLRATALPGHVLLETVSVMTRLPDGLAVTPQAARKALNSNFPDQPLTLKPSDYLQLTSLIAGASLVGGQVYDALVGYSAATANDQLLTRDKRATATYRAVGVTYHLVDE
jgi:predicted nucleic acid-binding protein